MKKKPTKDEMLMLLKEKYKRLIDKLKEILLKQKELMDKRIADNQAILKALEE